MKTQNAILLFCCVFVGFNTSASARAQILAVKTVQLVVYNKKAHLKMGASSQFVLRMTVNPGETDEFVQEFTASPGVLIDNPKPGQEPMLTPEGMFRPQRLVKDYVSRQFGGRMLGIFEVGEMPYSIFFHGGFAIHGSAGTVDGFPASKGCVRLRVSDAKIVFEAVQTAIAGGGREAVQIQVMHTQTPGIKKFRREMLRPAFD